MAHICDCIIFLLDEAILELIVQDRYVDVPEWKVSNFVSFYSIPGPTPGHPPSPLHDFRRMVVFPMLTDAHRHSQRKAVMHFPFSAKIVCVGTNGTLIVSCPHRAQMSQLL